MTRLCAAAESMIILITRPSGLFYGSSIKVDHLLKFTKCSKPLIFASMSSLQKIYETHHKEDRSTGFSILEDERGKLYGSILGTGKTVLDLVCRLLLEKNKISRD